MTDSSSSPQYVFLAMVLGGMLGLAAVIMLTTGGLTWLLVLRENAPWGVRRRFLYWLTEPVIDALVLSGKGRQGQCVGGGCGCQARVVKKMSRCWSHCSLFGSLPSCAPLQSLSSCTLRVQPCPA